MGRRKKPVCTRTKEVHKLSGKRKGAILQEEVWYEDGKVVHYSLVYINRKRCSVDNGRVLGFDDSHDRHHRHSMGNSEPVEFSTYADLVERFIQEVHEIWEIEDGKK